MPLRTRPQPQRTTHKYSLSSSNLHYCKLDSASVAHTLCKLVPPRAVVTTHRCGWSRNWSSSSPANVHAMRSLSMRCCRSLACAPAFYTTSALAIACLFFAPSGYGITTGTLACALSQILLKYTVFRDTTRTTCCQRIPVADLVSALGPLLPKTIQLMLKQYFSPWGQYSLAKWSRAYIVFIVH